MKKLSVIIVLILVTVKIFAQQKNVALVVDSIPYLDMTIDYGPITNEDIDYIEVVKDKEVMRQLGFSTEYDALTYVFTKAYASRPDSIKAIPNPLVMVKKNGTWYLKNETEPYSGPFIEYYINGSLRGKGVFEKGKVNGTRYMYYTNGTVSSEITYSMGSRDGLEKQFYEDGTLQQQGLFNHDKEVGVWEMYHPNGQLKQQTNFNDSGIMDGESVTYYSTGKLMGKVVYHEGKAEKDKTTEKMTKYYNQHLEQSKAGNYKGALKSINKALALNPDWAEAYFARGTLHLNNLKYDAAYADLSKAIAIEPYYTFAYANRAFSMLMKYEYGSSEEIAAGVLIVRDNKEPLAEEERTKICTDLTKAIELGDDVERVLEAHHKYCETSP